jgi:hypothetical protein
MLLTNCSMIEVFMTGARTVHPDIAVYPMLLICSVVHGAIFFINRLILLLVYVGSHPLFHMFVVVFYV